jgi:hypothetical protein
MQRVCAALTRQHLARTRAGELHRKPCAVNKRKRSSRAETKARSIPNEEAAKLRRACLSCVCVCARRHLRERPRQGRHCAGQSV